MSIIPEFMIQTAWKELDSDHETARKAIKALVHPELRSGSIKVMIETLNLTGWLEAKVKRLITPEQLAEYEAIEGEAARWEWIRRKAIHWFPT